MRFVSLLLIVITLGLSACAVPATSVPGSNHSEPVRSNRPVGRQSNPRKPRLWLATDVSNILTAAAAITPPAAPSERVQPDFYARWLTDWIKVMLRLIARDGIPPNRAARELMLISVALNDALLIAEQSGERIDQIALLAGAARPVLRYLHPQHSDEIDQQVNDSLWKGLHTANPVPQTRLERSFQIGHAIGDHVVAWARVDGSDAFRELTLPASGGWNTTKLPLDPHWGGVKTVVLPSGDTIILPPPPVWDSAQMGHEQTRFREEQRLITDEHRALAWHWHADVGTVTPVGLWFEIAITTALVERLDAYQTAALMSHLGVAMHDTAVACWYNKYLYGFLRPEQWMATVDPDWKPVLPTPPHPSYPSGHAAFSAAAAEILIASFPQHKAFFAQQAADAVRSRIVGGVHWIIDGQEGMVLGQEVARYVVTR